MIYKKSTIYKTILFAILFIWKADANSCVPRKFKYDSIVCVCNSTYCDSTPDEIKLKKGSFYAYTSSQDGLRFDLSEGRFSDEPSENAIPNRDPDDVPPDTINVNREERYQKILGFGGAFTDSAGINIKSLSEAAQEKLIESYYGSGGSRYNLGRVPIGGSDFSVRPYTYDDTGDEDKNLEHFKLAKEDYDYKIPLIKKAMKLSPHMKLTAAVWSPPPWMKTNNKFSGPSVLKEAFYQTYADYLVKFLEQYASYGINIWAISTGNEPSNAMIPGFPLSSMGWMPLSLGNWVADNLGPAIANSKRNETKLLILDDQRLLLLRYLDLVLANKKASNYIDGIAVHWYLDDYVSVTTLDKTQNNYPDKFILMNEACVGFQAQDLPKVKLGDWGRAQHYFLSIIQNMRHWVVGWVDWNIALDKQGGPNYIENYVDAPIITNSESDEFYKQPLYYAITHFSKFVERDSVRIESSETYDIKSVAFVTPSNMTVLVVCNQSTNGRNATIIDSKSGTIKMYLQPRSFQTIIYM